MTQDPSLMQATPTHENDESCNATDRSFMLNRRTFLFGSGAVLTWAEYAGLDA